MNLDPKATWKDVIEVRLDHIYSVFRFCRTLHAQRVPLLPVSLCANEKLILLVSSNWCLVLENLANLNREKRAGAKTSIWSQGAVQANSKKEFKSELVSSCSHAPDCFSLLFCPIVLHHSNLSQEYSLTLSLLLFIYYSTNTFAHPLLTYIS